MILEIKRYEALTMAWSMPSYKGINITGLCTCIAGLRCTWVSCANDFPRGCCSFNLLTGWLKVVSSGRLGRGSPARTGTQPFSSGIF